MKEAFYEKVTWARSGEICGPGNWIERSDVKEEHSLKGYLAKPEEVGFLGLE